MLARPLFAAGRRPVAERSPTDVSQASLPRLTGIVTSPGLRRAIFSSGSGETFVNAIEGDELTSLRVVTIRNDTVELDGADGHRIIRLEADQAVRIITTDPPPLIALIDPVRREAETENNQ